MKLWIESYQEVSFYIKQYCRGRDTTSILLWVKDNSSESTHWLGYLNHGKIHCNCGDLGRNIQMHTSHSCRKKEILPYLQWILIGNISCRKYIHFTKHSIYQTDTNNMHGHTHFPVLMIAEFFAVVNFVKDLRKWDAKDTRYSNRKIEIHLT